jgi:hypothetical protein
MFLPTLNLDQLVGPVQNINRLLKFVNCSMIDLCSVFHRSGGVLWSKEFVTVTGSPVDTLVKQVLLQVPHICVALTSSGEVGRAIFQNRAVLAQVAPHE